MAITNTTGINLDQIKSELGAYSRANNKTVEKWVYSKTELDPYCKVMTKIDGEYPAIQSVTDHVVQGFKAEWNELGKTYFRVNPLVAYKQKVNFPIVPAEVLSTWLASDMYQEGASLEQMPISKYIIENELGPKVTEDIAWLQMNGVYDNTKLDQFGYSMNGLKTVLAGLKTNTDNPAYLIQLPAITDSNIYDVVELFEMRIPAKLRPFIKEIHMSFRNYLRYKKRYKELYGNNVLAKNSEYSVSPLLNIPIAPFNYLDGDDTIFATPRGNIRKLIDRVNPPQITDIQKQDYKLKIFMEFTLGYQFFSNQMVIMSSYSGTGSGLGTSEDNELFYA